VPGVIGKTHFVKNEVIPSANQTDFVYLSLYGINSLKKLDKLIQVKLDARLITDIRVENIKPFLRATATQADQPGVLLQGSFEPDLKSKNLRPVVLFLDDLERWSGDLDQCLSYVNQLVEQENYKCLLVGNIDEIPAASMQAFANAREKTIRHVYHFENTYHSIFEIALGLPSYGSKVSERFLRSLVKQNLPVLQRLFKRVSIKNIRTVSEAFQLYDYVFQRNSKLFKSNRNLAFAYLMALQSALILVNKYLLTRDHRNQLMDQDHTEGKGYRYLSEIGYFDDDASGFLNAEARYLLDTIFYRMDQISLKGLFSLVRNGYYIKADFAGNFESWRKEQLYDTYLDKEKFYQLEDAQAVKVFDEMYASLVDRKAIKNPITILLLAERIIEDMAAGIIDLNPVQFKVRIIDTVDHLYESGDMKPVEVSIFDLSGERFINCQAIYNHVLKRNRNYQLLVEERHAEGFWNKLSAKNLKLESLMNQFEPAAVFSCIDRAEQTLKSLEALDNDRLHQLTNWVDNGIGEQGNDGIVQPEVAAEIRKLLKTVSHRYENKTGIRAAQFRRLSRKLKDSFLDAD
jgi:hypothetical protein